MHKLLIWTASERIHCSRDEPHMSERGLGFLHEDGCDVAFYGFETESARDDAFHMLKDMGRIEGQGDGFAGDRSLWTSRSIVMNTRPVDRFGRWTSLVTESYMPFDIVTSAHPTPTWENIPVVDDETPMFADC